MVKAMDADEAREAQRRRRVIEERRMRSYHGQAQSMDLDLGGRFAKVTKTTVTGTDPVVRYPSLPTDNPWNKDVLPTEPSLGYSIEDMEPTGEAWERSAAIGGENDRDRERK